MQFGSSIHSSRLPALVMEKLVVSLHELLETNPNIPLATKRSVLHDVARGLVYLHNLTPPIIHRDLTAKNVLLNSAMVAKVADLGVARIVDIRQSQLAASLTQAPGTIVYMPPEALEPDTNYDTKLDIFSFGNLALFSLTQVFPVLKAPTYLDRATRRRIARSEIERRVDYIQQIRDTLGQRHVLVSIVEHCLDDLPEDRPPIEEVIQQLEEAKTQIPDHYGEMTKFKLEQEIQSLQLQLEDLREKLPNVTQIHSEDPVNKQEQDHVQTQQLNLKWKRGRNVPSYCQWDVRHGLQANGKVYVNDGRSDIQVYESEENNWCLHCKAPDKLKNFAMTILNGQLVLTGGRKEEGRFPQYSIVVKEVAVWNSSLKVWEYPYPPMPTARHSAQSISYLHYLIVIGGSDISRSIASVEILDTSRSQWHIAEPLPKHCSLKQSACVLDTLYVLGSSSYLFRTSISTLVSLATSKRKSDAPSWEMLPDIRFQCSGLVAYEISLIAIDSSTVIPGIHVYNADTNEWTRIGDLPTALYVKLCVVLPSKKFFIISRQDEIYIGTPHSM